MYSLNVFIKKGLSLRIVNLLKDEDALSKNSIYKKLMATGFPCTLPGVRKQVDKLYLQGVLMKVDDEFQLNPEWISWVRNLADDYLEKVKSGRSAL